MKIIGSILLTGLATTFSIAQSKFINENKFVSIEGIEQWVTIKGDDISKPVILFIHGGPGGTMSQYDEAIYRNWEKGFVLVNWDQRGAGKTYGHNAPAEINEGYWIENSLTVKQMTKDGIELTKYLLNHLKKKKLILVGAEQERKAILETLNNETKAAFQRDYEAWKEKWVHDSDITKIYIDFPENKFSESLGWDEISQFVKTFIKEHPQPEPVPELLDKINIRLYGKGAWVTYEQKDSIRGLKRETRLMEKINGEWKIAGMQTTIYGFETNETE